MTNLKNSQQKVSQLYCFKIYQRTYFMFKFEKFDWLKAQSHAILIVCNVKTINYWRNMITSPPHLKSRWYHLPKYFKLKFCAYSLTEWDAKQEDQTDVNVWEDNWDDDAIEDDFSVQLRSELENQGMKMES